MVVQAANLKVEPANWWVGMHNPNVQLMVHGDNIANKAVQVVYPNVSIAAVEKTDNPNYLFITLILPPDTQPGTLKIKLGDDENQAFDFPLLPRRANSATRQGFTAADAVYLITPDRFANGNPQNDALPEMNEGLNRSDSNGRHGGDIEGILAHLDYIQALGMTQVWSTPVLENNAPKYSYHGYAITDFYRVDPRMGSNAQYRQLSQALSKRGMGLIMDVVLNHIGDKHWWMDDMPARDWLHFNGTFSPTHHQRQAMVDPHASAWDKRQFNDGWFVPMMPDLNQSNPLLATYLTQNAIWWIEYANLSGLRVDTYSYSDKDFLVNWTQAIMAEYPQLNIVGEEWSTQPAIVAQWQQGSPAFSDYPIATPGMIDFPTRDALLNGLSAEQPSFDPLYQTLGLDFLYGNSANLLIFPDNHDTPRVFSTLNEDIAKWKLAMMWLATSRGIPQLYYGTELLFTSPKERNDGLVRKDFPGGWANDTVNGFTGKGLSQEQESALTFIQSLFRWRKTSNAIAQGTLIHFAPEQGAYVYFRQAGNELLMVALNPTDAEQRLVLEKYKEILPAGMQATDVLTGKRQTLTDHLTLSAGQGLILQLTPIKTLAH